MRSLLHLLKRYTDIPPLASASVTTGGISQSRQSAKHFSSRWNRDSPTPLATGECAPPPFGPGGRAHSLAAKGVGPNSNEGTYTVVLYICKYFVGHMKRKNNLIKSCLSTKSRRFKRYRYHSRSPSFLVGQFLLTLLS